MSVADSIPEPINQTPTQPLATANWLSRIDNFCEELGDRLNPILVKETRQALKSRQFVVTFAMLLVAALGWTIVGSLSMMPRIYTTPSASYMLIGYYAVLAVPMLLVVPLAAYRSLENEIDDGTLELLSITVLSPWQIVLGKLASAVLQMLLYFVALFPCVAYAYTLRGIDLPTISLMIGLLTVSGLLLTVFGLFMAPLSRSKTGRVGTLLAIMMVLFLAELMLAILVIGMLRNEFVLAGDVLIFWMIFAATVVPSLAHLMLASTAAQLTPESENRSTQIRVSLLLLTALSLAVAYLAIGMFGQRGFDLGFFICIALAFLWTLAGSMMCAESGVMTPRIRRELPSSFLARMTLTWFTPGPLTGLVFSSTVILITTLAIHAGFQTLPTSGYSSTLGFYLAQLNRICLGYSCYVIGFLVLTYWIVRVVRIKNNPRVEIGIAAFATIALFMALVPYSIGLQLNDFRTFPYDLTQITNWVWTITFASETSRRMPLIYFVAGVSATGLLLTVARNRSIVMARRTVTPRRVQEELGS